MRSIRPVLCLLILVASGFGAEIKVKVVDQQSAAVSGAEVILLRSGNTRPVAIRNTFPDGTAILTLAPGSEYQLRVLAPGFAPEELSVPASTSSLTVKLHVASTTETVVVTATRTPVPEQEAGASVSVLNRDELLLTQPVAAADALRFLPGAIVETAGQRGGLASLFVRGGDSRDNKVIIDGVPANEPGGTFDFGVVPLQQVERLELLRGTQSTLYGSDAMTSVVQVWTRTGSTHVPQLDLGADGGNFATAHGFASLSGARGRFDYNLFGEQFNTNGQGINNGYSNSSEGGNVGLSVTEHIALRMRARHFNSSSGVPNAWKFNGTPLLPPDKDQHGGYNSLLGSAELLISSGSRWQHRFTGFGYNSSRLNVDNVADRGCDPNTFNFLDCYFRDTAKVNRAGLTYQGDFTLFTWAQTTFGYDFEDENGTVKVAFLSSDFSGSPFIARQLTHGLRLNHAGFIQQRISRGRLSVVGGARFVHNDSFGYRTVPRIAATFLLLRGNGRLSGTRIRGSYGTGIKEPTFEQSFGISGIFPTRPNPALKPEENRSVEAGLEQSFANGRYSVSGTYYHNDFRDQIQFTSDPVTFIGQYININRSLAHGAEAEFDARVTNHLRVTSAYFYTSTRIERAPLCTPETFCTPIFFAGRPLLRRPKHAGNLLVRYIGRRWGADLAGSFVGRRPDSDFLGFDIDHAAGYGRLDLGGWYAVSSRVTAYANVGNVLNKHYEEVVGYPALGFNFRAGLRFRIGGE